MEGRTGRGPYANNIHEIAEPLWGLGEVGSFRRSIWLDRLATGVTRRKDRRVRSV